ncbi:MAG: hypothetical protein AAGB93_13130 [Planctomycetota bacterium]
MNLSPKQLLRSSRAALGCGLVALAAAAATAAPAAGQRSHTDRSVGDVWQVTASKSSRNARTSVTIGNQGASFRADFGRRTRSRVPRGYDGGRYETRHRRVWVPGYDRQVWVAPVYDWRYDPCGRRTRVLVRAGYYRTECVPGRYESRAYEVWVPAPRIRVERRAPRYVHRDRVTHVGRRYR